MKPAYEILGVEKGADKTEIKRAYGKLIRKYRPETDPEKFMEIRKAYESLTKGHQEADSLEFSLANDQEAVKSKDSIEQLLSKRYWTITISECQNAIKKWPDCVYFSYLLTQAYRGNGNTGKAVKLAEELSRKEPGNRFFLAELGKCYTERGFTKKALETMGKAYDMGARDMDFLKLYHTAAVNGGDRETSKNVLKVMLERYGNDPNYALDILPVTRKEWEVLKNDETWNSAPYYREILEEDFLYLIQFYTKHGEVLGHPLESMMPLVSDIIRDVPLTAYGQEVMDSFSNAMKEYMDPKVFETSCYWANDEYKAFMQDESLSEMMKKLYKVTKATDSDPRHKRFMIVDKKLCLIEDRKAALKDIRIIEKKYPSFMKEYQDFFKTVKKGGRALDNEEDSLLKNFEQYAYGYMDFDYGKMVFDDLFESFLDSFFSYKR